MGREGKRQKKKGLCDTSTTWNGKPRERSPPRTAHLAQSTRHGIVITTSTGGRGGTKRSQGSHEPPLCMILRVEMKLLRKSKCMNLPAGKREGTTRSGYCECCEMNWKVRRRLPNLQMVRIVTCDTVTVKGFKLQRRPVLTLKQNTGSMSRTPNTRLFVRWDGSQTPINRIFVTRTTFIGQCHSSRIRNVGQNNS